MGRDLAIPRREEYYFAQIAMQIKRVLCRNPAAVKLEHFLFKFSSRKKQSAPTKEAIATRTARSKAYWGALITGSPKPQSQKDRSK